MSGLDLSLLRPLWLIALPALALLALMLRRRRAGLGDWHRVVDPALMRALEALGRVDAGRGGARGLAALAAAALIVLALAGPAVERRDAAAYRNLDGVVFVLDVSPSVTDSADWVQVQTMARFGTAVLGARPAALVVFGGDAYVAVDMTGDTGQLGLTLSLVEAGMMPDPGSRPERGLALAAQILAEASVLAGDVVLFSDGGGLGAGALEEAARIADRGARLSVVSLGVPGPQIQTLAAAGGGRAFGLDDTDAFAGFLAQSGRGRLEKQDYPLLFRADYGRWLLVLPMVLVLALFRRRAL